VTKAAKIIAQDVNKRAGGFRPAGKKLKALRRRLALAKPIFTVNKRQTNTKCSDKHLLHSSVPHSAPAQINRLHARLSPIPFTYTVTFLTVASRVSCCKASTLPPPPSLSGMAASLPTFAPVALLARLSHQHKVIAAVPQNITSSSRLSAEQILRVLF